MLCTNPHDVWILAEERIKESLCEAQEARTVRDYKNAMRTRRERPRIGANLIAWVRALRTPAMSDARPQHSPAAKHAR